MQSQQQYMKVLQIERVNQNKNLKRPLFYESNVTFIIIFAMSYTIYIYRYIKKTPVRNCTWWSLHFGMTDKSLSGQFFSVSPDSWRSRFDNTMDDTYCKLGSAWFQSKMETQLHYRCYQWAEAELRAEILHFNFFSLIFPTLCNTVKIIPWLIISLKAKNVQSCTWTDIRQHSNRLLYTAYFQEAILLMQHTVSPSNSDTIMTGEYVHIVVCVNTDTKQLYGSVQSAIARKNNMKLNWGCGDRYEFKAMVCGKHGFSFFFSYPQHQFHRFTNTVISQIHVFQQRVTSHDMKHTQTCAHMGTPAHVSAYDKHTQHADLLVCTSPKPVMTKALQATADSGPTSHPLPKLYSPVKWH